MITPWIMDLQRFNLRSLSFLAPGQAAVFYATEVLGAVD